MDNATLTQKVERYLRMDGWFDDRPPSEEAKGLLYMLQRSRLIQKGPVLDVGAGSCSDSRFLASQGARVIAIDVFAEPHVRATITRLPLRDGGWSGILCRGVVHLLHDGAIQEAIQELRRVLMVSGILYLTFNADIDCEGQRTFVEDEHIRGIRQTFVVLDEREVRSDHGDHGHTTRKMILAKGA